MRREDAEKLVLIGARKVLECPAHDHGAFALRDVAPEVLALRLGVAHEVEKVVLQLEGKAGVHAKGAERIHLRVRAAATDGADGERGGGGVERGLVRGHGEVVSRGDVPAIVARPAEVKRLALHGALLHLRELVEHAQLGRSVERLVLENACEGSNDAEVTDVDRHAYALGAVHAGLAAAHLALVGDVVVDEGGRLEVLDCSGRRKRARRVPSHGLAAKQHQSGPRALTA